MPRNKTVEEVLGIRGKGLDNAFIWDWYDNALVVAIESNEYFLTENQKEHIADMVYDLKDELLKHYPDKKWVEIEIY